MIILVYVLSIIKYLFSINLQWEEVTLVVLSWLETSGCEQNLPPFKEWNRSVCVAFLFKTRKSTKTQDVRGF